MSILSTEFDPEDGKFHIDLSDELEVTLTACQFVDFVSQSNCLIDYVVEEYFDGDMEKFFTSSHLEDNFDELDSKEIANMMSDWLKKKKCEDTTTGYGG